MILQLTTFANEVTRVALEVGTQGILGGQAVVNGVEGVWAHLTTNVNVGHRAVAIKLVLIHSENGEKFDRTSARDSGSGE